MVDLTPEKRAEWREACEQGSIVADDEARYWCLDLLDALAAEKAAREEAARNAEGWRAQWRKDTDVLEDRVDKAERDVAHWRDRAEALKADAEASLILQREAERREADRSASLTEVGRLYEHHKARADKAEQERDEAREATKFEWRRADAAEARVAALEAELAGWRGNPMAQKYAALVARINAVASERECSPPNQQPFQHLHREGCPGCSVADDLRTLTEKGIDHG